MHLNVVVVQPTFLAQVRPSACAGQIDLRNKQTLNVLPSIFLCDLISDTNGYRGTLLPEFKHDISLCQCNK